MPIYDGKIPFKAVGGLMTEQLIASGLGDDLCFWPLPYCSNLTTGRDELVDAFLKSECDKLFFLDSDITWEPGAIVRLAHKPQDFVTGCTRYKKDLEGYPILFLEDPILTDEHFLMDKHGLMEIKMIGTAFMCLSRKVFEDIARAHPERTYEAYGGKMFQNFFQMPFEGRELYGEDSWFCKTWRDVGGKIWLCPELEITHWKFDQPYVGHIGKWLRARMETANEENKQCRAAVCASLEASREQEISPG